MVMRVDEDTYNYLNGIDQTEKEKPAKKPEAMKPVR